MLTLVHSAAEADPAEVGSGQPTAERTVVPGTLLDFLRGRTTGPAARGALPQVTGVEDLHDADLGDELMDRLHDMYLSALPGRLSAISASTSAGNTSAVASAAITLAGTSGQLGHPEVASLCQAIAADARRGVLAHARVEQLQALAGT